MKIITWRIVATLVTLLVVYVFTRSAGDSLEITLTAALVSMIAYYIHERVWNIHNWGRK